MAIDNNAGGSTGPSSLEERTGCSATASTVSAQVYSFVKTTKVNDENPYAWLRLPSVGVYDALMSCDAGSA